MIFLLFIEKVVVETHYSLLFTMNSAYKNLIFCLKSMKIIGFTKQNISFESKKRTFAETVINFQSKNRTFLGVLVFLCFHGFSGVRLAARPRQPKPTLSEPGVASQAPEKQ